MTTVYQEGREEGRKVGRKVGLEEGFEEGIQKGRKVEAILHLVKEKFRTVPKSLEKRLLSASITQLDGWLSRLLNADSLDAVFKTPAKC